MRFLKFVGVGGTATAIHYGLLILQVELLGMSAVLASSTGYVISGVFNYTANYYFTFSSKAPHGPAAIKFVVVAVAGLFLNSGVVFLSTDILGLYYLFSQVVATTVVLFWNFFAHKHWTYRSVAVKEDHGEY